MDHKLAELILRIGDGAKFRGINVNPMRLQERCWEFFGLLFATAEDCEMGIVGAEVLGYSPPPQSHTLCTPLKRALAWGALPKGSVIMPVLLPGVHTTCPKPVEKLALGALVSDKGQ